MPIVRLLEKDGCWLLRDGSIVCAKEVVARLGWANRSRIISAYILAPLTLLFNVTDNPHVGVQLRYSSAGSANGSSAVIKSKALAKPISHAVALPTSNYVPIYPMNGLADLALMLVEPAWLPFPFDMAGAQNLPNTIGVYELSDNREIIRYGEGKIQDRIKEHLATPDLANQVRSARFFRVNDKEEALAFEHLLTCKFEQEHRRLPSKQPIRA